MPSRKFGAGLHVQFFVILHHVIEQGYLAQNLKNRQAFSENLVNMTISWEFCRETCFEGSGGSCCF